MVKNSATIVWVVHLTTTVRILYTSCSPQTYTARPHPIQTQWPIFPSTKRPWTAPYTNLNKTFFTCLHSSLHYTESQRRMICVPIVTWFEYNIRLLIVTKHLRKNWPKYRQRNTQTHRHRHTHTHTHTHTNTHTHTHAHAHAHTHTHTHTHIHTHMHVRMHACTHACTHARTLLYHQILQNHVNWSTICHLCAAYACTCVNLLRIMGTWMGIMVGGCSFLSTNLMVVAGVVSYTDWVRGYDLC